MVSAGVRLRVRMKVVGTLPQGVHDREGGYMPCRVRVRMKVVVFLDMTTLILQVRPGLGLE